MISFTLPFNEKAVLIIKLKTTNNMNNEYDDNEATHQLLTVSLYDFLKRINPINTIMTFTVYFRQIKCIKQR